MKKWALFVLISAILITGCKGHEISPEKTLLQIREFQTRTFDNTDPKALIKVMINVLQDDGFIIKTAEADLNILTAEKSGKTGKIVSVIECTANISSYGAHARARVNFQTKLLNKSGGISKVQPIEDPKYYQEFFLKVDKGLFIQKEKI